MALFPDVHAEHARPGVEPDIHNAASTPYTLTIMTWAAVIMTPVVIAYQVWTYWVFRKRLDVTSIRDDVQLPGHCHERVFVSSR